jgi:hypothetical protein
MEGVSEQFRGAGTQMIERPTPAENFRNLRQLHKHLVASAALQYIDADRPGIAGIDDDESGTEINAPSPFLLGNKTQEEWGCLGMEIDG